MPYLMAIVTDYAYPPDENVAVLNELKREHACYKLDKTFGVRGAFGFPTFDEWWFWRNQPLETNDEDLHFPFAWSDYDSDYKEQWWDQHEDMQNFIDRSHTFLSGPGYDWPAWMDSDAFERPEDLAFRFWDLNKH